jgi:hypothetical protein
MTDKELEEKAFPKNWTPFDDSELPAYPNIDQYWSDYSDHTIDYLDGLDILSREECEEIHNAASNKNKKMTMDVGNLLAHIARMFYEHGYDEGKQLREHHKQGILPFNGQDPYHGKDNYDNFMDYMDEYISYGKLPSEELDYNIYKYQKAVAKKFMDDEEWRNNFIYDFFDGNSEYFKIEPSDIVDEDLEDILEEDITGEFEQNAREWAEEKAEEIFNDIAELFDDEGHIEVWRVIDVPEFDTRAHDNNALDYYEQLKSQFDGAGIYWSYNEHNDEAYWGQGYKKKIRLHALATAQNIDWVSTIWGNLAMEDEKEITMIKNRNVQLLDYKSLSNDDGPMYNKSFPDNILLNVGVGSLNRIDEAEIKKLPNDLKRIKGQMGSNDGGLYKIEGSDFYVKFPRNPDIARVEVLANKIYSLLGVYVPQVELVELHDRLGISSKMIELLDDSDYESYMETLSNEADTKDNFIIDAWLANWDVAGQSFDSKNILLDKDKKPLRIDQGGALTKRAQGQPKGPAFGQEVGEIDTLRDRGIATDVAYKTFKNVGKSDIENGVRKLKALDMSELKDTIFDYMEDDDEAKYIYDTLSERRDYILDLYPVG